MTDVSLSPSDFEPIAESLGGDAISRPSLSYWQDAWRRLRENTRAIFSLYIVIGLLGFTLLGPLLWQVDPSIQDVDQVSQPPFADRSVMIVEPYRSWNTSLVTSPTTGLASVGNATTQSVRLTWAAMNDAAGYRVYRNVFPVSATTALGLPLGDVSARNGTYFEDRLDLAATRYYYSVIAIDDNLAEVGDPVHIEVDVQRVTTALDARKKNLTDATDLAVGTQLKLAAHPLGTDYLGRDLLARLMHGARVSLFIGIFAPLLYVLIGIAYGATAGFIGGVVDQTMMRFADFVVALPFLLFMIVFQIAFGVQAGESGILPMLIAMVVLLWPATARLVRGQILQIREEGYIDASRLLGAKSYYLIGRHMIPNTMGVILVTLTFAVPTAIFTEAFLSFIGMGVAPPTPSWGSMCNEGLKTMLNTPHELIFPALLISITVLAFNLLGDGLRDALDARMRSRD